MAGSLVKIVVTVPVDQADHIRHVMGDIGVGAQGNYTHCSFSVVGTGRFLPGIGANPAIGSVGTPEMVSEERIEFSCQRSLLSKAVKILKREHPYEEPAIDVYELIDITQL